MPSTPKLSDIWEYTLTEMLDHDSKTDTGRTLRFWVKTHKIDEFYKLLVWDVDDFTDHGALSSYMERADSEETSQMPATPLKQLQHLRKYIQYISSLAPADMDLYHEDHPLAMANWSQHSNHTFMQFVLHQHTDNFIPKPSQKQQVSNQQSVGFKKGIKREVTSYPTLLDERYFDSFSRSLYITAKSHDCDEGLDPDYKPITEDNELFENKQVFMFSVFSTYLLTDMG